MKKKLALVIVAVMTMGILAGCGAEEGTEGNQTGTQNTQTSTGVISVGDLEVEKYVVLDEYKGIAVTVAEPTVSEEDVEAHMQLIYNSNMTEEHGITNRAVALGDTVNIDYEGKKDDVAFLGGTATNQTLTIGSGQFIDGFEDGLIDVNPGETVDLNLTFPENYGNEELNGAAVVFTVTVNYIYPGVDEFQDEIVASWGNKNFASIAEMKEFSNNYLLQQAQTNYEYEVENAVMQSFVKQCQFKELPAELIAQYRATLQQNIEMEAGMYNTDAETWSAAVYGMELETFLNTYAEESAKQVVAFQAVANREGLNMTDEELEAKLSEIATQNGYASVDAFLGTNTRAEYKEYYMFEDVLAFLIENAVVTAQ